MSLSDLASLGSFVSGFAVLVSLIFLYFQLRQLNGQAVQFEKSQQAQIRQARADRLIHINLSRLDPAVTLAMRKGTRGEEDMSDVEIEQYFAYLRTIWSTWQDTFAQHRAGLMDEADFDDFETTVRSACTRPGMRIAWRVSGGVAFGKDFTAWMVRNMANAETAVVPDRIAAWRQAAAALKTGGAVP